jgi:hemolysin activation/secretion protein
LALVCKCSFFFAFVFLVVFSGRLEAAPGSGGQSVGATFDRAKLEKKTEAMEKRLQQKKPGDEVEGEEGVEQKDQKASAEQTGPRVLIKKIEVNGFTLLKAEEVRAAVAPFEGKEMTLDDFRQAADAITDLYRSKGYVTSFGYIAPQKVANDVLRIDVTEGKVGDVRVTGNKWYREGLLMRYVDLNRDEFLNYDVLRENIRRVNEMPDVSARAVLSRSETPGETDVEVQVKDRIPWHIALTYNNYNSTYLERNKYAMELKNNNFLGLGDILSGEVQLGEADRYQLYSARYLLPIMKRLRYGVYYVHIDQSEGRSLGDYHLTGKGDVINNFLSYRLVDRENFSLNINPAFEWKNMVNKSFGTVTSKDYSRIFRLGFDVDITDKFRGRTIVTQEFDQGVPDFLGGMPKRAQGASRVGAAANFFRSVTNAARIQAMPFSTVIMAKGATQLTNYSLSSSDQYQIGGYYTVRGYPASEYSGDNGYTASGEWHFPIYGLSKNLIVPFTQTSWRDAITVLGFFDWGHVSNNSPRAGESKSETIYSTGFGGRFNVPNLLSVSFDLGVPIGQPTSDGTDAVAYIETKLFF